MRFPLIIKINQNSVMLRQLILCITCNDAQPDLAYSIQFSLIYIAPNCNNSHINGHQDPTAGDSGKEKVKNRLRGGQPSVMIGIRGGR